MDDPNLTYLGVPPELEAVVELWLRDAQSIAYVENTPVQYDVYGFDVNGRFRQGRFNLSLDGRWSLVPYCPM